MVQNTGVFANLVRNGYLSTSNVKVDLETSSLRFCYSFIKTLKMKNHLIGCLPEEFYVTAYQIIQLIKTSL